VYCVGNAPHIAEPVLDRRARHGDAKLGIHRFRCVCETDTGRLNLLRLIEEQRSESDRPEVPGQSFSASRTW
jgi:hypothetical protein